MKVKIRFLLWTLSTLTLASVVVVEVYCLLVVHLQVFGGMTEYQQDLYKELLETAYAAKGSRTVEDLMSVLNATSKCTVERETSRYFPDWSRREYEIYYNGSHVLADWTFYDIDPILNYRGTLKIAEINGVVEFVRLEYFFWEEE